MNNVKWTNETTKRAIRTFLQAVAGYILVNLAVVDFSASKEVIKSAVIGLAISAVSAGISAIMNLQSPANEIEESKELGAGGLITYDEFVKAYVGKSVDYDGVSGVQCVDLAKLFLDKVLGIKAGAWGNAKDYYENFNNVSALKSNFTRIANSADFVAKKGDICVWGKDISDKHNYGHIAIATGEGNTKEFYTYDQNWNGKEMKKVKHNYNAFLGVLRPKDQSMIKTEKTNTKSSNPFKAGDVVTLTTNVNVRKGAGTGYSIKKVSQLTADGKKNATSKVQTANAVLKSGTKVTIKALKTVSGNVWAEIPSGYICLCYNGKYYVK